MVAGAARRATPRHSAPLRRPRCAALSRRPAALPAQRVFVRLFSRSPALAPSSFCFCYSGSLPPRRARTRSLPRGCPFLLPSSIRYYARTARRRRRSCLLALLVAWHARCFLLLSTGSPSLCRTDVVVRSASRSVPDARDRRRHRRRQAAAVASLRCHAPFHSYVPPSSSDTHANARALPARCQNHHHHHRHHHHHHHHHRRRRRRRRRRLHHPSASSSFTSSSSSSSSSTPSSPTSLHRYSVIILVVVAVVVVFVLRRRHRRHRRPLSSASPSISVHLCTPVYVPFSYTNPSPRPLSLSRPRNEMPRRFCPSSTSWAC